MEEAGRCDDPHAIHRRNIFKSEVIEKPNYYKIHFSLTEEKRELLETVLDATISGQRILLPLSQTTKYHDDIVY